MRWLAELGAKQNPPVKIAYESWCFSKRVSDWEHTWKIVQLGVSPASSTHFKSTHQLIILCPIRTTTTSVSVSTLPTPLLPPLTAGTPPPAKAGPTNNTLPSLNVCAPSLRRRSFTSSSLKSSSPSFLSAKDHLSTNGGRKLRALEEMASFGLFAEGRCPL